MLCDELALQSMEVVGAWRVCCTALLTSLPRMYTPPRIPAYLGFHVKPEMVRTVRTLATPST